MWKILTAQIWEEINYLLISRGLFPEKPKEFNKQLRETGLLYIHQNILNDNKTRLKNIALVWIDYKKKYDMVRQSCIIECLKRYKIAVMVIKFIEETMKNWRVELTGKSLADVKIQWDALSSLLFVIAMMPLNHIVRKCTGGYKLIKSQENMNPLMSMDNIKNEKELRTLIQVVRIYSQDIGIEFGIEKCAMLIRRNEKWQMTEEIKLPNQ